MSYIGQAPGLGQRSVFRFVALQGQTVFSGRDAAGLVLAYAVGTSTLVAVNGRLLSGPDYTATDGSTLTIAAPLSVGDEVIVVSDAPFSPANTYTTDAADVRFTRKRNRITNPGMRVSQEYGSTLFTVSATGNFIADQVLIAAPSSGGYTLSGQQVASPTPGGSTHRVRVKIVNAANPAAGDSAYFLLNMEGLDVADLMFGTAKAKTVTIRFGVNFPAGTYSINLRHPSNARNWAGQFTVSSSEANTDVLRTFVVPGDTLGTWPTTNVAGLSLIIYAISVNTNGQPGWTATPGALAGQSSFTNVAGATFELFDVGLYEGGTIPPFELPSYDEDLRKCHRYFYTGDGSSMGLLIRVWNRTGAANDVIFSETLPVPMRVNPTINNVAYDISDGATQTTGYTVVVPSPRNVNITVGNIPNGTFVDLLRYTANARL